MKVLFFKLESWEKEYIESRKELKDSGAEFVFVDEVLDKDHIPKDTDAEIISTFVNSNIDEEVLKAFPNLKYITTRSTGYDHIDVASCKKQGIVVSNVPSYGENTVAEYTFALILSLTRKIHEGYDQIRETGSFSLDGLRGTDLKGKTLGVVGTGRIGKNVVRIAKGFGMNVIACDKFEDKEFAEEMGLQYCEPLKALREGDIVTLHVPYSEETHHLINETTVYQMKKGAYLVNTSRGAVVETMAIVKAVKDGHLAGAAFDVLEEEGAVKDELSFLLEGHPEEHNLQTVLANHVLIDLRNVIITPHNAFNTTEALQRILDTTIENMKSFSAGKPANAVDV